MKFEGTERYYLSPELGEIVNISISMEKPLLLMGEAGTGKTRWPLKLPARSGFKWKKRDASPPSKAKNGATSMICAEAQ